MIITTTITLKYRLEDREVEEFKNKVLEYIQDEFEEENITINDITIEKIKEYLSRELPDVIAEMRDSSCGGWGIELDNFNTISFDFYGDVIRDMIQECANEIRKEK